MIEAQQLQGLEVYPKYTDFVGKVVSPTFPIPRTKELIYIIDIKEFLSDLNEILEFNIWYKFEELFLKKVKELFTKASKFKTKLIHIKLVEFEELMKLAFEALIERGTVIKEEIIRTSFLDKKPDISKTKLISSLDNNLKLLRILKEKRIYEKKEAEESADGFKKIMKNILSVYMILLEKKFKDLELIDSVYLETLGIWKKYNQLTNNLLNFSSQ
ncbi:MAG: hypothetical protein KAT77_04945 [Nanoarchaeota archaeon]|nr:hypothetical protein [Nanoarchaeota archaeon]